VISSQPQTSSSTFGSQLGTPLGTNAHRLEQTSLSNRSFTRVFNLYVLFYAFLFASRPVSDADFWFHLKTGQYVFQNGAAPYAETWSFTYPGLPWVAHGWLSGTFFYGIYVALGLYPLIFLFAVLAALSFWIVLKDTHVHPFIFASAFLLGMWSILPNVGVRPRVFTLLLASIFLTVLQNYARTGAGWRIWLLIPLTAVWGNLHGGFVIGPALILLTSIGVALDAWLAREKLRSVSARLMTLSVLLMGSLLAALVNPYGIQIYDPARRALSSSVYSRTISDWVSPNFHDPALFPLLALILLSITAFALSPKRIRPSELLLFAAALYATLKAQRNVLLFAVVAVPLLARYLQFWLELTPLKQAFTESRSTSRQPLLVALSVVMLLPLPLFIARLRSTAYAEPEQQSMKVPIKAVEYMRTKQLAGNTFTFPNIWGGYVIWELPSNPVYIDGRDVYPERFVAEYVELTNGRADWKVHFDQYGVKLVLIQRGSLLARQLDSTNDWERVYQDEMSSVYKRR
jgi:hypothetical protein